MYKPHTIDELVTTIFEDNYDHFEKDRDCDCAMHVALAVITRYWDGN